MIGTYRTLMKTCLAQNLQYRFALLIWLIAFMLEPLVYLVVWLTVAKAKGGSVGGYSESDLAVYFIVSMPLNHLTFDWHLFEMEMRVRSGSFSPLLLRPLHPVHMDLADNIVYKMMTAPFMFAAAGGLYLYFRPAIHTHPWALALFVPALAQAFAMRFLLEWTLGLSAFWTTRVQAVNTLYFTVTLFMSGRMVPLGLMMEPLQSIARALPFRLWLSFPVELLLGGIGYDEALRNLALQSAWIAVFFVLFKLVWAGGMKRFSAVGA